MSTTRLPNFIIGGTEKAGTTSVFDYLCGHPQVCGSSVKETDFFRKDFSGDLTRDLERYGSFFTRCDDNVSILMEASPGYLGEAESVAPKILALVPNVKLLFILRNPAERFYSSYNFHKGKLNLPENMTFEEYIDLCLKFEHGECSAADLDLGEWYLKVLRYGRYSEFLRVYRNVIQSDQIKVMFFENLREDPRSFMNELSEFLGISTNYWTDFSFGRSNVTFSSKNHRLHRFAVLLNEGLEPLLRRQPRLKRAVVRLYKAANQKREGYEPMSAAASGILSAYYATSVTALRDIANVAVPDCWFQQAGR